MKTFPVSACQVGMVLPSHLSWPGCRSGFQHLYKRLFGVSVMSDVIKGRLDRAKRLLSSTNLTVREIGERCGYSNEFNFMRQFKDYVGKTPTEYRKIL